MELFRRQEQHFLEIRTLLERGVYHAAQSLCLQARITKDPIPYERRADGPMVPLVPGQHWGDLFDCAWVHVSGTVPQTFPNEAEDCAQKHWAVLIDLSAEGLVYNPDGEPVQGLTSATSRNEFPLGLWGKRTVELKDCTRDGRIDFWADFTCCDVEGQYRNGGRVREACLAWVDDLCRDAFYDWVVCQSLFVGLMENGDAYGETVGAVLERATAAFEAAHGLHYSELQGAITGGTAAFFRRDAYFAPEDTSAIEQAGERISILPDAETEPTKKTQLVLDQKALHQVRAILSEILSAPNPHPSMVYSSIGHSHLDLLFLWTERETYRKCARTLANVLRIMDVDPTYKFTMSQAPVFRWLKEQYPSLDRRMQKRIEEGRFELVGSLYIECDTNLPGGESLARQLLYGKRFFRETFGQDMRVCFLPDVFGYSAALPQLLKLADVPYFTTNKLSMNDTNRFPRYTFWWYGLDGSRVLTHMLPENSYTSAAVPQMAIYGAYHDTDKDLCPRGLQLFGLGDGGGGPGYEHVERRKRMRNLRGCPTFEDEFVADFFDRINVGAERYRAWHGELYFERHQGTYTSIARQKLWNRTLEKDLHALEFAAALANDKAGYAYPAAWLKTAWEDVLLYQFHDCLPGSAIPTVYDQTQARYAVLHEEAQALTQQALSALGMGEAGVPGTLTLNASPFARREEEGEYLSYAIAWAPLTKCAEQAPQTIDARILENRFVRLIVEPDGTLSEIFDKTANRSLLKPGKRGNLLMLYPDELTHWDINKAYLNEPGEQAVCTGQRAYRLGASRIVEQTFTVGKASALRQKIVLEDHSACVRFITSVDWQEEYQMLRVAFPSDVVTDRASCEIQFGHIDRPTHRNTSWDEAKFEVCAHKWVDMADASGGLALLNDCKYGYNIRDNTLDLCLLRSQNCPAEHGDRGTHAFTYAICPHGGDAWTGGVIAEGYRLNTPLIRADIVGAGGATLLQPFILEGGTAILETVKKAEDSDDLLLRFYEARGGATRTTLRLNGYRAIGIVNLLEEPMAETLQTDGDAATLPFHAFEIKTVRIRKKG